MTANGQNGSNPPAPTLEDLYTLTMQQAQAIANIGNSSSSLASQSTSLTGDTQLDVTGKPSGSRPFLQFGFADLSENNGVLPAPKQIIITYRVPSGYNSIAKRFSCNIIGGGNFDGTGSVVWQLLRGTTISSAVPVANFDNITSQVGDLNTPYPLEDLTMWNGETYLFVVQHVADVGISGKVACSLSGFEYPAKR